MSNTEITGLHRLSAAQAAMLIKSRQITSVDLVSALLDRVDSRDKTVGAWQHLEPERALEQARQLDAREPAGPLHGVPVGVKDIIDTFDTPTAYGSGIYRQHRPSRDATCVRRLRSAGAVIMGKTVTTEFALFHPGKTANPRDVARTPGGSSSGSAAAVVDCMVPVALGTQTAGSIIRPASFCGTFGFKPTFGALSRAGIREISPTMDTLGHFARSVEDLALVATVLAGHDPADPATRGTTHTRFDKATFAQQWPRRIAFIPTSQWDRVDPRARARIEEALTVLTEVDVDEVSLPPDFDELVNAQISIMEREAFNSLRDEWGRNPELISSELAALLERGRDVSRNVYEAALERAIVCRRRLLQVFEHYDFVITPSVLGEAPIGLQSTGDPLFCRMWTLLGAPAVAVPGLIGPDGLPLGVQVIGPLHRDDVALAAAEWLSERLSLRFTSPQPGSERK